MKEKAIAEARIVRAKSIGNSSLTLWGPNTHTGDNSQFSSLSGSKTYGL